MRSEIESLFEKIGFREQALISYRKIVTFLDSKFQYNKSDLYSIIDRHLLEEITSTINGRVAYWEGMGSQWGYCSETCEGIANNVYPGENDGTARRNAFVGCFKCCMVVCGQQ